MQTSEYESQLQETEQSPYPLISVFICYRRTDGLRVAKWLHEHLHNKLCEGNSGTSKIQVYLDVETPTVPDWTKIHRPSLEGATAFLFVVTPGVLPSIDNSDWVHAEINWWLKNRSAPPIVIETTGDGNKWIPKKILHKWPNLQRIEAICDQLEQLPDKEKDKETRRLISIISASLQETAPNVRFEQVYRLRMSTLITKVLGLAVILLLLVATSSAWIGFELQHANTALIEDNSRLNKQRQKDLADQGVKVSYPQTIVFALPPAILNFESARSDLTPQLNMTLIDSVAPAIVRLSFQTGANVLDIVGFTDEVPFFNGIGQNDEMQISLGMKRAMSVASIFTDLIKNGKLGDVEEVNVLSAGPFGPYFDKSKTTTGSVRESEDSRQNKRRVEIRLRHR